ncbi:MAG: DUF1007 family protein [Symbiopectobacterium sp.]
MLFYNIFCRCYTRLGWRCGVLFSLLSLASPSVWAHPHSFIDIQTTVEGENDTITGLRMHWTMDPITSADLLYDVGKAKSDSEIWKKLAAEVMANVLGQHYFTEIYRDNAAVKFQQLPTEYHLSRQGNKAVLEFLLPLVHPQPLQGAPLQISTYDPTYFVDMSYQDKNAVRLAPALAEHCKTVLFTPTPSADLRSYALSLDKADATDEDLVLGKQFAQHITLECH